MSYSWACCQTPADAVKAKSMTREREESDGAVWPAVVNLSRHTDLEKSWSQIHFGHALHRLTLNDQFSSASSDKCCIGEVILEQEVTEVSQTGDDLSKNSALWKINTMHLAVCLCLFMKLSHVLWFKFDISVTAFYTCQVYVTPTHTREQGKWTKNRL